ncbi:MAG: type II secretion system protein GspK [Colwellia sp.]
MSNQQGIALIQVLLISAVLSVLALFLTMTAKDQIKIAQWQDDKMTALIAMHNTEAELLYSLLVHSKISNNQESHAQANIVNNWNFFNNPFTINGNVKVEIQDQSALIHAHFPDKKNLEALIIYQGYSIKDANSIIDNLLDWQDIDNIPRTNGYELLDAPYKIRNGAVPDVHDFSYIENIPVNLFQILVKNTTLYGKGFFNPMNSSKELLSAITSVTIAEQVMQLREQKKLTPGQFSQLTGITENDKVILYPSNILAIELIGSQGISTVKKKIIVELNPYANEFQVPINILSSSG